MSSNDSATAKQAGTICLTVDYDAISVFLHEGRAGARGVSRGEFGIHEGAPRLLETLRRFDVTATWFVPGVTARQYPDAVAAVAAAGHEIGNHGYRHEDFAAVGPEEARAAIVRGSDALEEITGERPVGVRLPGGDIDGVKMEIVAEEGFRYDSSLIGGYRPRWTHGRHALLEDGLIEHGPQLDVVELSWHYGSSDRTHLEHSHAGPALLASPRLIEEVWRDEIDDLADRDPEGFLMLIVHPEVIGRGSRLAMLERIIAHAQERGYRFATGATVAEEFRVREGAPA